jgi:hypothetical protein
MGRRAGLTFAALGVGLVVTVARVQGDDATRFNADAGAGNNRQCSFTVDPSVAGTDAAESHFVRYYKCFNRRIRLEVDRQTGIGGIPQGVVQGGGNWDLWSIYALLSLGVDVIEDDTNIPDLAGACYSLGEMDAFFAANQDAASADPGDWNVWAGMVDCDTNPTVLGRMFRNASNERDGFAVFVTTVQGSCITAGTCACGIAATANQAILRTTAHELGHALNLCHQNGDSACIGCAGTTIMNQSGTTGPGWSYTWSTAASNHISSAAQLCIEPGTSTGFGVCPTNPCNLC